MSALRSEGLLSLPAGIDVSRTRPSSTIVFGVIVALLPSGPARAGDFPPKQISDTCIPVVATAQSGTTVDATASSSCLIPGRDGVAPSRVTMPTGSCDGTAESPITWGPSQRTDDVVSILNARWQPPSSGQPAQPVSLDVGSQVGAASRAAILPRIAANEEAVLYKRTGTFQPDGSCSGSWTQACSQGATPQALFDPACVRWTPRTITAADSPPPLPASLAPSAQRAARSILADAGRIQSAPSTMGVVNIPICFWPEGISIRDPNPVAIEVMAPGPAVAAQGSWRITYTYLMTVYLQGLRWNFDDPQDPANTPGGQNPACGNHPLMTTHLYVHHSQDGRHADGKYHVSATAVFTVSVKRYWIEAHAGTAVTMPPQDIDIGDPGISAAPTDYSLLVGQVIAVPVNQ